MLSCWSPRCDYRPTTLPASPLSALTASWWKSEWQQVSKGGENPLGFYQDSCEEPLVSHRGTGKLSNRVVTETSAHLATVEEQLHGCAVKSSKTTLIVTTRQHKNVGRCWRWDCDLTLPPVYSYTNVRFCGKQWKNNKLLSTNWLN